MNEVLTLILAVAGIYVFTGVLFAVVFVLKGVDTIDRNARGAGIGFRIMIFPGSALFWPLLIRRWLFGAPAPAERNAHRDATREPAR